MDLLLFLISFVIVFRDIRDHIISNRALLVLAIPLLVGHEVFLIALSISATFALLLLAVPAALGGGDIKLLLLLIWFAPHSLFSTRHLMMLLLIIFLQLLALLALRKRSSWRDTHIPLAPALLLPILGIHLGI
jgi:Flp pilus assembly protein protease CpaA